MGIYRVLFMFWLVLFMALVLLSVLAVGVLLFCGCVL